MPLAGIRLLLLCLAGDIRPGPFLGQFLQWREERDEGTVSRRRTLRLLTVLLVLIRGTC